MNKRTGFGSKRQDNPAIIATGMRATHNEPLGISRGLMRVPEEFLTSEAEDPVHLTIVGPHEIATSSLEKSYVLSAIGVRCLNACLLNHQAAGDRNAWFDFHAISETGVDTEKCSRLVMTSTALWRTVRALEEVRFDIDGKTSPGIIEREGSGSGSHVRYRIASDLVIHDSRTIR